MAETTLGDRARRLRPDPSTAFLASLVLGGEALLALVYAARPEVTVTNPLVLLYPFVWIDVALLAVVTTRTPAATPRRRWVGLALAAGYFLLLAYVGGLVGAGSGMLAPHVSWSLPPGYGPAFLYDGSALRVVLEPYKVVGYLALAYLVYVTVLDAAGAALSGVLGLFSCVSCTWPILGTVAAGLFGSTSAVAAVALGQAYGLSTVVFVTSVALLWWRPTL
jgi:hypothetical protein